MNNLYGKLLTQEKNISNLRAENERLRQELDDMAKPELADRDATIARLRQELAEYEAAANKNQVISLAMSKVKEANERLRQELSEEQRVHTLTDDLRKRAEADCDEAREVARRIATKLCGLDAGWIAGFIAVEVDRNPWLEEESDGG